MRFTPAALTLLIAAAATIPAQSPERFEVASVRPTRPGTAFSSRLDPAQFTATANSLLWLVMSTYPNIPTWRIAGGPAWLNTEYWDVAAKLPPNMSTAEAALNRRTEPMLEILLADRFKLALHREKRDQQVYALIAARGGAKLKPSSSEQFSVKTARGRFEFQHQSMDGLAAYLYYPNSPRLAADRPVIDMTGIPGYFDFTLEWTPDGAPGEPAANGPSIFTALDEQLGLKLQAQKSAVEFLVIDHAERPSTN